VGNDRCFTHLDALGLGGRSANKFCKRLETILPIVIVCHCDIGG